VCSSDLYLRGLDIGVALSDEPTPAELQGIAQATKDRVDATQIHTMLLRAMQQAIYTASNSGHFGLAYEAYTHFTSPIRRYPDLLVHRVIKALLAGKRYHLVTGEVENPAPQRRAPPKAAPKAGKVRTQASAQEMEVWEGAGAHCSANERRADEASRDVEAWLKCRFMREHLGEEYSGTVSAATSFGLFVTLDELYVEGLVHITELGGEYYRFDEVRQELRGERTGVRYAVGTRVRVQVIRVDLDARKIDFRLIREGEDPDRLLARGRKPAPGTAVDELDAVRSRDRETKAARGKAVSARQGAGAKGVAGKKARATAAKPAKTAKGSKARTRR
jgi:ribonuclease R